jgi:hypothetical protein
VLWYRKGPCASKGKEPMGSLLNQIRKISLPLLCCSSWLGMGDACVLMFVLARMNKVRAAMAFAREGRRADIFIFLFLFILFFLFFFFFWREVWGNESEE